MAIMSVWNNPIEEERESKLEQEADSWQLDACQVISH